MNDHTETLPPAFGRVDFDADYGLFVIDTAPNATCRLTLVARTERGYPRRELAAIPGSVWKHVATAVQNELIRGMDPAELGPKPPAFRPGDNAVSPLVAREIAVLLWSLMEDTEGTHVDALLTGWRQLAPEERWWLYARSSNPSQRQGHGWRRALYFALTDPADDRTSPRLLDIIEAASDEKKNVAAKRISSKTKRKTQEKTLDKKPPKKQKKVPYPAKQKRKPPKAVTKKTGRPKARQ